MGAPEKSSYLSSFVVNLCDEERETNITSGNGFERRGLKNKRNFVSFHQLRKLVETNNNNNELYLHDHTSTYSIAKAMFRNQNYNTGQLRYFDDNLSRTSKQAEIYFMNCILIK